MFIGESRIFKHAANIHGKFQTYSFFSEIVMCFIGVLLCKISIFEEISMQNRLQSQGKTEIQTMPSVKAIFINQDFNSNMTLFINTIFCLFSQNYIISQQ